LARDFGEGEVEGGDEEEGVVAEAVFASGGAEELAFGEAFGSKKDLAVACEGEVADESGGAVGLVLHEVEDKGVVAVVLGAKKYRGLSTTLRFGRDDDGLGGGFGRDDGRIGVLECIVIGEAG